MSRRAASAATVAARTAVDRALDDLAHGDAVLVGCSGGPDSLALAGVTAWVAARRGLAARAVVVDHGLQPDSAAVAARAVEDCGALGVPAVAVRVQVGGAGGPEAAARAARMGALEEAAAELGARAVLLGHTRDDQAETVLLRLARGSGARSLSGMARRSGLWRRPFLDLPRSDVRQVAAELLAPLGREPWSDPHNDDPAFARVRVRALLGGLATDLGPGVVLGLVRSADLLRDDADALDAIAEQCHAQSVIEDDEGWSADCTDLASMPRAVRTRVIRLACVRAGSPAEDLGYDLVQQVAALIDDWHGQGAVHLPGGVRAERLCGRLCLRPTRRAETE